MVFKRNNIIPDVIVIEPQIHTDKRGYFAETFCKNVFEKEVGYPVNFIQENESLSTFGIVRGLHYQIPPMAQSKLVRVVSGKVLDVAVDIRKNSPSYGKYVSVELNEENHKQLFVPLGFAHGFVVLSNFAKLVYKVDNYYSHEHDCGIQCNDKHLAIDWILKPNQLQLSNKDSNLPNFEKANKPFFYKKHLE